MSRPSLAASSLVSTIIAFTQCQDCQVGCTSAPMELCFTVHFSVPLSENRRSQWPPARSVALVCGRSTAEIVGSNPTGGMDVCCECCVLSVRGLCDGPITRPEESNRLRCVVVWIRRPWPTGGCCAKNKQTKQRSQLSEYQPQLDMLTITSVSHARLPWRWPSWTQTLQLYKCTY